MYQQWALTIQGAIDYGDLRIYLFTWVYMTQDHFDVCGKLTCSYSLCYEDVKTIFPF